MKPPVPAPAAPAGSGSPAAAGPPAAAAAVLLAGAGLLTACSNAPVRYYTLSATPGTTVAAAGRLAPVRVSRVSIPAELDRRGLTNHTAPDELHVADSDQWAASLPELIRKAVTADLGQRLGYEQVLSPDSGSLGGGETTLALDFSTLSADEKCSITSRIYWIFESPNHPLQHGTTALSQAAAGCPAGLPAALTQLLGQLSDELAGRLAAAAAAPSPAPPPAAPQPAAQ